MHLPTLFASLALAQAIAARSPRHVGSKRDYVVDAASRQRQRLEARAAQWGPPGFYSDTFPWPSANVFSHAPPKKTSKSTLDASATRSEPATDASESATASTLKTTASTSQPTAKSTESTSAPKTSSSASPTDKSSTAVAASASPVKTTGSAPASSPISTSSTATDSAASASLASASAASSVASTAATSTHTYKRPGPTLIPQNANTTKFGVDGTGLPNVNFDIGESYAGLLPVSSKPGETRQLYFWFFPSANPLGQDEITIWLNGGPGCSSLEGFFQENGPVLWQYGTYRPVPNPYTWVNLTSMIWVEQPVGTGFSQGVPDATNETTVATEFLGFFKNFIDTFALQNKRIYITGESYAGYYVPYIADAMLNTKDTTYYDLQSIMIYDPSTSYNVVQEQIPMLPFVEANMNLFHLNATTMSDLRTRDQACGYAAFRDDYLVFPPTGILPTPPSEDAPGCDLWDSVYNAVTLFNPCFDIYQIATTCPLLWDVLGFPGSIPYLPAGASVYFNRTDVQRAINAPVQEWNECSNGVLDTDTSPPSGLSVLPGVIERTKRTVIGHGSLDMILIANGTLLMIQNMTWNGGQGFSAAPADEFYVPYHNDYQLETLAGAGVFGVTRTERGLTYVETWLSGHMIPQYAPSAAYRQLEFMLGRIDSLSEVGDFTTQTGNLGN